MMKNEAEPLDICKSSLYKPANNVVIPEPYLPYVPDNWNGILVLGEAQNLSPPNDPYVKWLRGLDSKSRMRRLGACKSGIIGVQPWDDGNIPLALKSINGNMDLSKVAISNAVPWSRSKDRKNVKPDACMMKQASRFWNELLNAWEPKIRLCIVFGRVSGQVLREAGLEEQKLLELRLPAPNLSIPAAMFEEEDLLKRFCEVRKALGSPQLLKHAEDWQKKRAQRHRAVFFACHAVSKTRYHPIKDLAE